MEVSNWLGPPRRHQSTEPRDAQRDPRRARGSFTALDGGGGAAARPGTLPAGLLGPAGSVRAAQLLGLGARLYEP